MRAAGALSILFCLAALSSAADPSSIDLPQDWKSKPDPQDAGLKVLNSLVTELYSGPFEKEAPFQNPREGWVYIALEPGAAPKSREGLSWLQGRYPRTTTGDIYLLMTRSAEKANIVRQTLKGLEPGRAYSLKLFAFAPQELDRNQDLARSVDLKGAERIEPLSFRFTYPSNCAHEFRPYNREHPACINYFRFVFRAGQDPVELVISDWSEPGVAGGPARQEVGVNFVPVQPYRMP